VRETGSHICIVESVAKFIQNTGL